MRVDYVRFAFAMRWNGIGAIGGLPLARGALPTSGAGHAPDLRRPGGDRDPNARLVPRDAGGPVSPDGESADILRVISEFAHRRAAGVRGDRRQRQAAAELGIRHRAAHRRQASSSRWRSLKADGTRYVCRAPAPSIRRPRLSHPGDREQALRAAPAGLTGDRAAPHEAAVFAESGLSPSPMLLLMRAAACVGVLCLLRTEAGLFSESRRWRWSVRSCDHAGDKAIQNARLFAETQDALRRWVEGCTELSLSNTRPRSAARCCG